MRLAGKRALLTASGAGIGRATALAFAREGAAVVCTDIDAGALASLKEEMPAGAEVDAFVLDARDLASVKVGVERAGDIDILFNCAGWVHHGTILETTEEEWDFSFDLNVKSMWRTLTCALPGMIARGGGSVVNMSSAASSLVGAPNRALYGATKAAVIGLTKAVA
ncbi:MAG: SDR family NAD(P)-dependent oxidoreductase, partial [Pseudomonadota bacterium]